MAKSNPNSTTGQKASSPKTTNSQNANALKTGGQRGSRPIQSAGDYLDEILPLRPGTAPMTDIFELIARDKIEPWPVQPRTHITAEQVEAKRHSISEGFQASKGLSKTGIEMPLIVRYHPDPQKRREGYVMLIDGELRWRGTEPIHKDVLLPPMLPCNVRDVTEEEAWEIAAVSGVQRQEYTSVQEANIVARFMSGQNREKRRLSVREAAERFGKTKSWVTDRLVIADPDEDAPQPAKELIAELQHMVSERSDTLIHARELKKVADPQLRRRLIRRVVDDGLSLDRLRELIHPQPIETPPSVSERAETTNGNGGSITRSTSRSFVLDGGGNGNNQSNSEIRAPEDSTTPAERVLNVITDTLVPAKNFLAEAVRVLDNMPPSATLRRKIQHECDELQERIEAIRKKSGG